MPSAEVIPSAVAGSGADLVPAAATGRPGGSAPRSAPPKAPSLLGPALWRTGRGRTMLWQIVAAIVLLLCLRGFVLWLVETLGRQNLGLGLDFLHRTAGINISEAVLPYSSSDSLGWLIVVGAANTLRVSLTACLLATVLGIAIGVMRISSNVLLVGLTGAYVNLVRNTPLLLQLLFWYALLLQLPPVRQAISLGGIAYFSQRGLQVPSLALTGGWLPLLAAASGFVLVASAILFAGRRRQPTRASGAAALFGGAVAGVAVLVLGSGLEPTIPERRGFNFVGGLTLTPEFAALVFAQSFYASAFIAELVRGGIESVARGQREAGASLGLSAWQVTRLVVLPQAMLVIIPSVTTQYVGVIKNSSLAIAVGFPDLFWALTSTITITGHSIEGIAIMLAAYLVPTALAALALGRFNERLVARGQKRG